jgi:hypothetical protein
MLTYQTALDRLNGPRRQDQKWWGRRVHLRRDGSDIKVCNYNSADYTLMVLHPDGSITLPYEKGDYLRGWRQSYRKRNPQFTRETHPWLFRSYPTRTTETSPLTWINLFSPPNLKINGRQVDYTWVISVMGTWYLYKSGMRIYPSGKVTKGKLLKDTHPDILLKINGGMLKNPRHYLEVKGIDPESDKGKKILARAFRARIEGRI